MCRVGVTVLSGAAGEIAKESRAKATLATRRHYGLGGGHRNELRRGPGATGCPRVAKNDQQTDSRSLIAASIF
jgi:uncharacterized membrane protein